MTVREFVKYLKDFPYQYATIIMASDEEGNSFFNLDPGIYVEDTGDHLYAVLYPAYPEVEL
jgi:hypothetical protein